MNQLIKITLDLEGDTAECGVYKGNSSKLICQNIQKCKKTHYAFDSFEGLSKPDQKDGKYWTKGDLNISEQIARDYLKSFPFVKFMKGWIPSRFDEVSDKKFSFVHIDVDLYEPTKSSLDFFYPRMTIGGIILCDDSGHKTCPGVTKAMEEFFKDKKEEIIKMTVGSDFIIKK